MPTAVLLSGGLDSAVLARRGGRARRRPADLRQRRPRVGSGRARHRVELPRAARRSTAACGRWSRWPSTCATSTRRRTGRQGRPPAYHTPDEDVYLPGPQHRAARQGRRLLRRGAASIASSSARSRTIRFPTRRRRFARRWRARCRSASTPDWRSTRRTRAASKAEVIRRGAALGVPLELTLSCMNPPPADSAAGQSAIAPFIAARAASAASATTPLSTPASRIRPPTPARSICADAAIATLLCR